MNNDTQIITHKVFTLFVHNLYDIEKKNKNNCYYILQAL